METTLTLIQEILRVVAAGHLVLDARNLWTFAAMCALLLKGKKAHLYELGRALPCKGKEAGRVQKIRRWLSNPRISPKLFLPLFLWVLGPWLSQLPALTLIIDRTEWKRLGVHINLFICSVAFKGRSFPLYWCLLSKEGCSSLQEQKALLRPVLQALAAHPELNSLPKKVVADREFCSPKLARWLKKQFGISFAIRVKKSYRVHRKDIPSVKVEHFLEQGRKGEFSFFEKVILTDNSKFKVQFLVYWRAECEEPIALITDSKDPQQTLSDYRERTFIETLNRDLKSSGYDLEKGRVTHAKRIENFLIALSFSYIFAVLQGTLEELKDPTSPLRPRHLSLFTRGSRAFEEVFARKTLPNVRKFFQHFFDFIIEVASEKGSNSSERNLLAFPKTQLLRLQLVS